MDIASPNPIAIFSGRSEKAKIISAANLKRFCNVYDGLPSNLLP